MPSRQGQDSRCNFRQLQWLLQVLLIHLLSVSYVRSYVATAIRGHVTLTREVVALGHVHREHTSRGHLYANARVYEFTRCITNCAQRVITIPSVSANVRTRRHQVVPPKVRNAAHNGARSARRRACRFRFENDTRA